MTPSVSVPAIEDCLREGSWKIIPPLKRVFPRFAPVADGDAVPAVAETEAWDMNDLRRMSTRELELLILDLATEHHVYAAMAGYHPNFGSDGNWTWYDCWMGYTLHRDEHEFLVHKAYALLVSIVFPDIFHHLRR